MAVTGTPVSGSGGGKTLAQLRAICRYHGWHDNTTDGVTALDQFINDTLQMLANLAPWPEFLRRDGSATFCSGGTPDDDVTLDEARLDSVGDVISSSRSVPLDEITPEEWLFLKKYHAGTGPPVKYAVRKSMSAGAPSLEMLVYPSPTAETVLYYTWRSYPTVLSDGTDIAEWPDSRVWLLTEGLRVRLATVDRDTGGAVLYSNDFMAKVNRAYNHSRPSFMPIIAASLYQPDGKPPWRLRAIEKTFVS